MITTSETVGGLNQALAKVLGEVTDPPKTKSNDFIGYKYATLDDCLKILRPVCAKHGVSFVQLIGTAAPESGLQTCTLRVSHEEQWIQIIKAYTIGPEKGLSLPQVDGKYQTYIRRYQLLGFFGITADEDTDAAAGEPQKTTKKRSAPKPTPAPAPVSEEQEKDLKALIEVAQPAMEGLLAHFGVDSIGNMTGEQAEQCMAMLRKKIEKMGGES